MDEEKGCNERRRDMRNVSQVREGHLAKGPWLICHESCVIDCKLLFSLKLSATGTDGDIFIVLPTSWGLDQV
jgi:hypothetical protein